MDQMLIAAFPNRDLADATVRALEDTGIVSEDISVITQENVDQAERMADTPGEGAAQGATTGAAVGGLAGLLAGAGIFPALAGLLIGGPIAAALGLTGIAATAVSGAVTGALAGGLIGALTRMGVSEEEARAYESTVKAGGVILGVPVDETNKEQVRTILEDNGAEGTSEVELKS